MINDIKEVLGFFDPKEDSLTVTEAVGIVQNKFGEISKALKLRKEDIFNLDFNHVPFVGSKPCVLHTLDSKKLRHIKPVSVPTTFFVTGDAYDTKNLSKINRIFRPYDNLGMPNSHKFAQSLICKTIMLYCIT